MEQIIQKTDESNGHLWLRGQQVSEEKPKKPDATEPLVQDPVFGAEYYSCFGLPTFTTNGLEHWLSTLILQPFSIAPHVVTPNYKIISLLLHNYSFTSYES